MSIAQDYLFSLMNGGLEVTKTSINCAMPFVGKRITSLKKENEKKEWNPKETTFIFKPVLDIGFSTKQTKQKNIFSYIQRRITTQLVIPAFEKKEEEKVLELLHPSIQLELEEIAPKKGVFETQYDRLFMAKVYEKDSLIYTTEAGKVIKKNHHYGRYRKGSKCHVADIYLLCADLLIWSEIRKFIDHVAEMTEEERNAYIPYAKALEMYGNSNINISCHAGIYDSYQLSQELKKDIAALLGVEETFFVKRPNHKENVYWLYLEHIIPYYVKKLKPLPLNLIFDESGRASFQELTSLFMIIANDYDEEKADYEYEMNSKSDYAKSFEEKKNIPKHIRKAMDMSLFHSVFSYVEYDETVDLLKVAAVEKEFVELNKILFKQGKLDGYNIRFRRLGCHKAAGLYYPCYKCICIDIDNPNSFCHEFMHMLDYMHGKASKANDFRSIYERYVDLLENCVEGNPALAKLKKSNTKYNLKYYKRSTEVFARCGEIFISRILGIDSSLAKIDSESDFAYPRDKELEKMIASYYSDFLQVDVADYKQQKKGA